VETTPPPSSKAPPEAKAKEAGPEAKAKETPTDEEEEE
jgi:hypothetical protein